MKMTSQSDFGRSDNCVQMQAGPDKWAVLQALSDCAETYGLNNRSLGVLKALMTFLPQRTLPLQPGAAIVYPSNRTLSHRLSGMPESTLRRHLAQLVRAGVVSRSDSPNRKRYARKVGGNNEIAFGFDLAPLAAQAGAIETTALRTNETRERCAVLRDRILVMRHHLQDQALEEPIADLTKILRRKLSENNLLEIIQRLEPLIEPVENTAIAVSAPAEMSAPDSQNERHIQDSNKSNLDSEERGTSDLSFYDLVAHCKETNALFPDQLKSWPDVLSVARRLVPMLGIDQPVWVQTMDRLGPLQAAIAVFCIHEKMGAIRNPGGYLRHLGQQNLLGRFNIMPMVRALRYRPSVQIVS